MSSHKVAGSLLVSVSALLCSVAFGQYDVLVEFDDIRVGSYYERLGVHAFEGDTMYAICRGTVPDPYAWVSQVTRTDDFLGTPVATELVSYEVWAAFTGTNPYYPDGEHLLPGRRLAVFGDYLQFVDWSSDAVYRVHKTTGDLHLFVSNSDMAAFTGQPEGNLIAATAVSTNGAMAIYDQPSDAVLLVEVNSNGELTTNGALSYLITDDEFDALYAHDPINNVSGGMTFAANSDLYWTLTQTGSTGPPGGAVYRRRASDGELSQVLSELDIQLVTFSFGNVGFNDVFAAPDGNVYFQEQDSDSILYFSPDDPVNTLAIYLTQAELLAGPAVDDYVNVLGARGPYLTWNHMTTESPDLYAKLLAGLGDIDDDGDEDMDDFAFFPDCMAGPGALPAPAAPTTAEECLGAFDFDFDQDIDLADFIWYQEVLGE